MSANVGSIQTHSVTRRRRVECVLCAPVWRSPEFEPETADVELEAVLVAHAQAVHGIERIHDAATGEEVS